MSSTLENLKSEKFGLLSKSQMSQVIGGDTCATQGSYSKDGGKTFIKCPDRQECDGVYKCTEYFYDGAWR
jgi:hypothetical protein